MIRTVLTNMFIAAALAVGLVALTAPSVEAVDVWQGCSGNNSAVCGSKEDNATDIMRNVINTILVVLGMIAVIMIIIGGIRYTTSNGDSSSIKSAKDTILYAVIGLAVAILSFAIVDFVLRGVEGGGSGSGNSSATSNATGTKTAATNGTSGTPATPASGTNGGSTPAGGSGGSGGTPGGGGGTSSPSPTTPAAASSPAEFACEEYRMSNSAAYNACQSGYTKSDTATHCATTYAKQTQATNKAACEKGRTAASAAKPACTRYATNGSANTACQAGYLKSGDANYCTSTYANAAVNRNACVVGRNAATA